MKFTRTDVGTRGAFYDATGALRDMVPNHLFQLLAMVGMEPPNSFGAEAIRNEKAKLLDAVRIPTAGEAKRDAVRGRYTGGTIAAYSKPNRRRHPRHCRRNGRACLLGSVGPSLIY